MTIGGMDKPVTFLVVEDDEIVRRLIERALAKHGDVVAVGSCASARLALRSTTFDALVLDVNLPDGRGLEVLTIARARSPALVAIVLTGSVEHDAITQCHEQGASFLLKPPDLQVLVTMAQDVKGRRNARERRMGRVLERWTTMYRLTPAETELLTMAVAGISREEIARRRCVSDGTTRKQIQFVLKKTRCATFEGAVSQLLREALSEPI